jgi:hypothetical protein
VSPISTVADLVRALLELPQDLPVFVTNGDLPAVPVGGVAVGPADFGQLVLISGQRG